MPQSESKTVEKNNKKKTLWKHNTPEKRMAQSARAHAHTCTSGTKTLIYAVYAKLVSHTEEL